MSLTLKNITYSYKESTHEYIILENVNCTFEAGNFYTIMGPSGSGKTTLLSIASGLTSPSTGTVLYEKQDVKKIGISNYRKKHTSIIFQSYNLIPYMTAFQNVKVALQIKNYKKEQRKEHIKSSLNNVGLNESIIYKNVQKLSGGQQQRVAIARALVEDSQLIFADEPTGNLDQDTSKVIIDTLKELAFIENKCVIMVTHDQNIAKQADIALMLKDRRLIRMK